MPSIGLTAGDGFEPPDEGLDSDEPRAPVATYYDTADRRLARAGISLRRRGDDGRHVWQLRLAGASQAVLEADGAAGSPPEQLTRLVSALARRRPLRAVAAGGVQTGAALGRPPELPPSAGDSESALTVLQAMIAVQLAKILEHDPGARLGDDPEDVHQLRVATRRLRAFLRAARPLLDEPWAEDLRAELGWLGGALGPVRDLDVLVEYLSGEAATLEESERAALRPLFDALAEEHESARRALVAALESERYLDLLDRLEGAALTVPPSADADGDVTLRSIWKRELRRLRKRVHALPDDPSDEELHAARIKAKRARYAAELADSELGKPGRRFVDRAKALQDVLGEHQDAVVAEERLRAVAATLEQPAAQVALGRLVERQGTRRGLARDSFAKAWRKLDAAGRKAAG